MFSQAVSTQNQKCALCNGTNFYKEDGYYFCSNCQTQNEEIREEVLEYRYDTTTRLRKIKVRSAKSTRTDVIGWTSWELYNFALIGMTNELIEIGADPSIKQTVLQLWSTYLAKLEVAFTSKTKKCVPKMARRFHKKDADIIYGKIVQKRKRKKKNTSDASGSSFTGMSKSSMSVRQLNKSKRQLAASEYEKYLQSQPSSDTDALSSMNQSLHSLQSSFSETSDKAIKVRFNKRAKLEGKKAKELSVNVNRLKRKKFQKTFLSKSYIVGPDIVTPLKLLSILYIALRIHNQDFYISDLLRFCRETHLSYYKMNHLLPEDVLPTKDDVSLLTKTKTITHKGLRQISASMVKFLSVNELAKPNFLCLLQRYCEDLNLPRGISLYAERLYIMAPSMMIFDYKQSMIPNYEGRAMGYVIVVLKVLFGLDDATEKEMSRVVEKINRLVAEHQVPTSKLFSFCEWQKFVECRKRILVKEHFPTKLKYDPSCSGQIYLLSRFMETMRSNYEKTLPFDDKNDFMTAKVATVLKKAFERLNGNTSLLKELETFPPSFTPNSSYILQLLNKRDHELPTILQTNFCDNKVGYITKPHSLVELALYCGIKLETVDHSIHFWEKIVPAFALPPLPSVHELSEIVTVPSKSTVTVVAENKIQNLLDYSHRNRSCKMKINPDCLKHYSSVYKKLPELEETLNFDEDSLFDKILPDGRLDIKDDSDSGDEIRIDLTDDFESDFKDETCFLNEVFQKKLNISLYDHELKSVINKVEEVKFTKRDSSGRFTKETASKNYKRISNQQLEKSSEEELSFSQKLPKKKKLVKKKFKNNNEDEITEVPIDCFSLPDSDISILEEESKLAITQEELNSFILNDDETLFRPFRDYWMYHCTFSRVKGKNFELFKKELPENFVWLLEECAKIVEMTTEELYEEVCFIEAYHFHVLKSKPSKHDGDYIFFQSKLMHYKNKLRRMW